MSSRAATASAARNIQRAASHDAAVMARHTCRRLRCLHSRCPSWKTHDSTAIVPPLPPELPASRSSNRAQRLPDASDTAQPCRTCRNGSRAFGMATTRHASWTHARRLRRWRWTHKASGATPASRACPPRRAPQNGAAQSPERGPANRAYSDCRRLMHSLGGPSTAPSNVGSAYSCQAKAPRPARGRARRRKQRTRIPDHWREGESVVHAIHRKHIMRGPKSRNDEKGGTDEDERAR